MTCCFIGHRKIKKTPGLTQGLREILLELIKQGTDVFLFGDHSEFNSLCYDTVTELKSEYPHICRIHYRTAYQEIDDSVRQYFAFGYEDSICPQGVAGAGRSAYAKRNRAMIRDSDFCVFYFDETYQPNRRRQSKASLSDYQPKSGTKVAFEYAENLNKEIINLCSRNSKSQA